LAETTNAVQSLGKQCISQPLRVSELARARLTAASEPRVLDIGCCAY